MAVGKQRSDLTELELCVLGAVWLRGPCSAYVIRREFAESSSSYWSSSAGSIYPVIERLLKARLITVKADPSDGRGKRSVAATKQGAQALKSWIADLPRWASKATLDPIRTRMNFIAVLESRAAQRKFIALAQDETGAEIAALSVALKSPIEDAAERLTTLGALYELEGRMKWLRVVGKALRRNSIRSGRGA